MPPCGRGLRPGPAPRRLTGVACRRYGPAVVSTPRSEPMAGSVVVPTTRAPSTVGRDAKYTAPLAVLTTLFFMWGFITCLNDIIIPHLKAVFELNYAQAMMIQFAFFAAYFVMSLPSGAIVK